MAVGVGDSEWMEGLAPGHRFLGMVGVLKVVVGEHVPATMAHVARRSRGEIGENQRDEDQDRRPLGI
jgi:hypothetical protein